MRRKLAFSQKLFYTYKNYLATLFPMRQSISHQESSRETNSLPKESPKDSFDRLMARLQATYSDHPQIQALTTMIEEKQKKLSDPENPVYLVAVAFIEHELSKSPNLSPATISSILG